MDTPNHGCLGLYIDTPTSGGSWYDTIVKCFIDFFRSARTDRADVNALVMTGQRHRKMALVNAPHNGNAMGNA